MEDVRESLLLAEELERRIARMDLEALQPRLQARNIVKALERLLELCEWDKSVCRVQEKPHWKLVCETALEQGDVFRKCRHCGTRARALDVGTF